MYVDVMDVGVGNGDGVETIYFCIRTGVGASRCCFMRKRGFRLGYSRNDL